MSYYFGEKQQKPNERVRHQNVALVTMVSVIAILKERVLFHTNTKQQIKGIHTHI